MPGGADGLETLEQLHGQHLHIQRAGNGAG